uniref:Membrane protein n=1 Tax=Rhipicephalus appendiculatus TaxID=34631 RepID=A0A131YVY3_RHIAP
MALLRTCCCWLSVRKGSFASGIYTLIFYTMLVATGACHLITTRHSTVSFMLIVLLLILSGFCIVFSVVLLLGLFFDHRLLLLPWLAFVSTTTVLDVALSFYFITDLKIDAFVITMYIVDYALCSTNVYCIMCVVSQYQQYTVRSHASEQRRRRESLAMVTTRNRGDGGGGQSGDRSAFVHIRSWYMRWLSRKTSLPRSDDTVPPCRVVVPADTTYSADEGAVAAAPGAPGGVPVAVTRKKRSQDQMSESPFDTGRCADESSTGRQLCTEETSVQHCVEQGEAQLPGCEALDDLSVETELQHKGMTLTKEIKDHGGGFIPESQPLLDAPGFIGIDYQKGTTACDRA